MKYSKQRESVFLYVKNTKAHPSADIIYHALKKDHPSLSLGTVYRNLNFLTDHGMIEKITVPSAADRFDGDTVPHYHFFCVSCGSVFDMSLAYHSGLDREAEQAAGGRVISHSTVFKGICPACKHVSPASEDAII